MKHCIVALLLVLFIISCKSKSGVGLHGGAAVVKLDLTNYKNNGLDVSSYRVVGDTSYQLIGGKTIYREIICSIGDVKRIERIYDKEYKNIVVEHLYYSDCRIGISRYFDENGNITNETDNDAGFVLSVKDIVEILERKIGKKLEYSNPEMWNLTRSYDPKLNSSKYFAIIYVDQYRRQYRYMEINGSTGEIIKDTIAFHEE